MHVFPALHRSRVRLALTLVVIFIGLVAAIGAALSAWYVPSGITALFASTGLPTVVDATTTLAVASLVLACLGVMVAAIPLPHHTALQKPQVESTPTLTATAAPPPGAVSIREQGPIPAISVYVDAENNPFSGRQLLDFFAYLDAEIGDRRADRIYYMDANRGSMPSFRGAYSRGGFRLVDVPHESKFAPKRPEGTQTVNAVDVALALDVIERALLGPAHQTIILITADRDYFPLIGRLKELGHTVQMWARSPSAAFIKRCGMMGISWKNLDKEIPPHNIPPAIQIQERATPLSAPSSLSVRLPLTGEPPAVDRGEIVPSPILPAFVPLASETGQSTLLRAIEETIRQIQVARQPDAANLPPGQRYTLFKARLGGMDQNILREIGYDRQIGKWSRLQFWIAHLQAIGILAPGPANTLPRRSQTSSVSPEDAAQVFYLFLREVARATQVRATQSDTGDVRYLDVADSVAQPPLSEDETARLRLLIQPDAPRRAAHLRFFCSCARQLGLMDFREDDPLSDFMHEVR